VEHDPAVIAGVCLVAEKAIMQAVDLSAGTREQLKGLYPLTIAVNCSSPAVNLYVTIDADGAVTVASYREESATVRLAGSWRDFLGVAAADDPASALINGNIQISGDTAPLLRLQAVLADLDIDWEAPLAETLGPVAGHQLAAVIRAFTRTSQSTHQRLKRQLSEFILEEGRLSPPQAEQNAFFSAVDDLVLRVDRADSRVKRIKKRLAGLSG
jgi:ubiquinone biosynthesis protein UbiJ